MTNCPDISFKDKNNNQEKTHLVIFEIVWKRKQSNRQTWNYITLSDQLTHFVQGFFFYILFAALLWLNQICDEVVFISFGSRLVSSERLGLGSAASEHHRPAGIRSPLHRVGSESVSRI